MEWEDVGELWKSVLGCWVGERCGGCGKVLGKEKKCWGLEKCWKSVLGCGEVLREV